MRSDEYAPGSGAIESIGAKISHYALYGFMIVMPATGIAMGYFGGKGLPFFYTTLPGAAEKNGAVAGQSFKIHKLVGTYGKYIIPLHVAGAGQHAARGHSIFSRINPFR
jgi:1,2-dihydroxy-3-keto-5-methylthiopentene dioxygenase